MTIRDYYLFEAYFLSSFVDDLAICLTADAVKELYDKMLKSVKDQRTAPPNAWLWSLIENCTNSEDIKLLFNILETLRRFVSQ